MGHAEHDRKRRATRSVIKQQIRAPNACVGSTPAATSSDTRFRERAANGSRNAARTRSQKSLWVRRRGGFAEGFVGVDLVVASRQRQLGCEESNRNSSRTRRAGKIAGDAERFQSRAAACDGHKLIFGR